MAEGTSYGWNQDPLAGRDKWTWQVQLEQELKGAPSDRVLWIQYDSGEKGEALKGVTSWIKHYAYSYKDDTIFFGDAEKPKDVHAIWLKRVKDAMPAINPVTPRVAIWEYGLDPKDKTCYGGLAYMRDGWTYDAKTSSIVQWPKPHMIVFSKRAPDFSKISLWKVDHRRINEVKRLEPVTM